MFNCSRVERELEVQGLFGKQENVIWTFWGRGKGQETTKGKRVFPECSYPSVGSHLRNISLARGHLVLSLAVLSKPDSRLHSLLRTLLISRYFMHRNLLEANITLLISEPLVMLDCTKVTNHWICACLAVPQGTIAQVMIRIMDLVLKVCISKWITLKNTTKPHLLCKSLPHKVFLPVSVLVFMNWETIQNALHHYNSVFLGSNWMGVCSLLTVLIHTGSYRHLTLRGI